MKLTVADPPYLGPAELWHGGKGRTRGPGTIPTGCTCGRGVLDAEYYPDAAQWDDPQTCIST